jgi:hypothetical protein
MNTLKVTHSSGFFSCCSKRLEGIVWAFNTLKVLPDRVDSSDQFSLYKTNQESDLTGFYFAENNSEIAYKRPVDFYNELQFSDYSSLDFQGLLPIVQKYFTPSDHVKSLVLQYEKKYNFDYNNLCGIFYRGNDKGTETSIAAYDSFISQARKIKEQYPDTVFLVQTDETEFLEAFKKEFARVVVIEEIPHMTKRNSAIHDELPQIERREFGASFFAALLILSKAEYLVTHSGNGGMWAVLYRGNCDNVYQWLNNSWKRSTFKNFMIRTFVATKKRIKRLLKKRPGYFLISESTSVNEGSFSK